MRDADGPNFGTRLGVTMRSLIRIIFATACIVLLVVGSILGYNRWRIERLAETVRQKAAQFQAKHESEHANRNARIAALRAADKVADPLKRCLDFPDVSPLHWSPAFVAARCRLTALDIITIDQIDAKLAAGDSTSVDATFQDYAAQDVSDPKRRGILFRAFEQRFESSNPAIGSVLERWVKTSPLWGGSREELEEIADAAKAREASNPLMALVAARVRYYYALASRRHLSRDDYLEILAIAPDNFALDNMGQLFQVQADAPLITPLVRFEPTVGNYMRAALALQLARQPEWSHDYMVRAADLGSPTTPDLEEYAQALTASSRFDAAAALNEKMIEVNPRNAHAMSALIVLYQKHLNRQIDAVAMAHRMLDAYPDSFDAWTLFAYTQKETNNAEYCSAMARAYRDKPGLNWDYDHSCTPNDDLPPPMPNGPISRSQRPNSK